MKAKITFMMIAYNAEKTINRAVRSILNQTERNILVLVRNNGSTDRTQEILEQIAAEDDRLHIYRNEKNWYDDQKGHYTKDGVVRIWPIDDKELLGEYVTIVDSDDMLTSDFAEKMYSAAKENEAQIVVCGNDFINDKDQLQGTRMPPEFATKNFKEDGIQLRDCFLQFYNCFRTWWAKLFETDFFLQNYEEAWQSLCGHYSSSLDTIIMHRYLKKCQRLCSVTEAMYGCVLSPSSTYANPVLSAFRAVELEQLHQSGISLLEYLNIRTLQNDYFLYRCSYAFFIENIKGFERRSDSRTEYKKLGFLAVMINNKVFLNYGKKDEMLQTAMDFTEKIMRNNIEEPTLYRSYLARLFYVKQKLQEGNSSLLFYPIVLGCLYDPENKWLFGSELLGRLPVSKTYAHVAQAMTEYQIWEAEKNGNVKHKVFGILKEETLSEEEKLEESICCAYDDNDIEGMADLIQQMNEINPLNPSAMLYQIYLLDLIGEKVLAVILACTAKILFTDDITVQAYCADYLREVI